MTKRQGLMLPCSQAWLAEDRTPVWLAVCAPFWELPLL